MARVKSGKTNRARHKKVLKRAKGYYSAGSRAYIHAVEKNDRGMAFAYRDRKTKNAISVHCGINVSMQQLV